MGKNFWDKDYGWDKLYTSFEGAPGESSVFVGVLRSSGVYKPGKKFKKPSEEQKIENRKNSFKTDTGGVTVAQIAAIHEFGSKDGKHPPERSFMRSSIDANKKQIESMIKKLTLKITEGRLKPLQALGLVGQFVKQKMVAKINAGIPPALAKSTIERKGSSKPLIDTGQLKGSIDFEVVEGKGQKG